MQQPKLRTFPRVKSSKTRVPLIEAVEVRRLLASLVSSTTLNGVIATDTEVDTHTIVVNANDPLVVALGNPGSGGFVARVQVLNPSGSIIADDIAGVGGGTRLNLVATQSGTYTIRVFEDGQDASGNYTLTAFRIGTQVDPDTATVESGRRFAAVVGPGDLDVWTISATQGQQLSVIVTENNSGDPTDLAVTFVAPDGTIISNVNDEAGVRVEHKATQTGTYYAVVSEQGADETGTYGITFTRLPGAQYSGDPDTAFLEAGEARDVNLPGGDADVWSFYAEKGVSIVATLAAASGSNLDPQLLLYGPDGSLLDIDSGASSATVGATAPSSGNYWIVGRDFEADTGGAATFVYSLSSGTGAGPIRDRILTINGTSGDDRIGFSVRDGSLLVSINNVESAFPVSEFDTINVYSGNGHDRVDLSAIDINTYVSAGSGDDTVVGGGGKDSLTGGGGRNRLYGGDNDDRLNGSNGRDYFYGEGGNDRLYGNDGNDYLDGGGGVDRLYGGDGDDSMIGGSSNDKFYAGAGNDTLNGGNGRDLLNGDAGNDVFYARDGYDDILNGGSGTDFANADNADDKNSVEVLG